MKKISLRLMPMLMFVVVSSIAVNGEVSSRTLFNTQWTLTGFFNAETNQLEQPDSAGGDSYTLAFAPDSVVVYDEIEYQVCRGKLSAASFWGFYTADYAASTINFEVIIRPTTTADSEDGERFDRALYLSRRFELGNGALKMFYGDKGDYLLFGDETRSSADNNQNAIDLSKSATPKVASLGGNLTAAPNPVSRSVGAVDFYREGNISRTTLKIYDASGKFVRKIQISGDNANGNQPRRKVGSWDLKDAKGKTVAVGTYVVKGTVKVPGGKREQISLLIGVR